MSKKEKQYRYSETFYSIQGEGRYMGYPTIWIRWFGCNLKCPGFSQEDLSNPSSWERPWETIDVSQYKSLDELPIFKVSCDSGYSWSKRIRHLVPIDTTENIAKEMLEKMKTKCNPKGLFINPESKQDIHLAFTGGEPMMSQPASIGVLAYLEKINNKPKNLTIETNGTRPLKSMFVDVISDYGLELFWSISPKIWTSGEKWEDSIKPEIVKQYYDLSPYGQLKFVVNDDKTTWEEVKKAVRLYRDQGVNWPVYVMPVGARDEQQNEMARVIADKCLDNGYYFSPRLHCSIYGNTIGT